MNAENLSTLKIHKLTQTQYDRELEADNIDKSAIYMVPDTRQEIEALIFTLEDGSIITKRVYISGVRRKSVFYINKNGTITKYTFDAGMTWAEWFASDYNTTGKTEGTITDANGNEVSMDAFIVDGTAYEVEFSQPVTVTITASGTGVDAQYGSVTIDGIAYASTTTVVVPVGTVITCVAKTDEDDRDYYWGDYANIYLNGNNVGTGDSATYTTTYEYTVTGNVAIDLRYNRGKSNITITET